MATESSAIARLVADTQNQGMPGPDGVFEPLSHPSDPPAGSRRAPSPVRKSGSNPWWLLVVAIVVIGGSVAGGYVLAQQQGEPGGLAAEGADSASVLGGLASGAAISDEEAEATVMPPVPAATAAAEVGAPDAAVEDVETDMEPELGVDALALAAKTGFDILVEPKGAKVTLDGNAIGAAPLRVRNLLPGTHRIDIEGPDGYFGQHQEFELGAGEAMVLRLSLDSLGNIDQSAETDEVADLGKEKAEPKVKKLSKRERLRARREARKKAAGKKRGKATAAPSASEERALAGAGSVSLGTLMLGAKPPCEIVINGKKTGLSTPQRSIQLPEGVHRVVLINDEHDIRKTFKVRIKSGRTTRAIQDLTKKL